MKRSEAARNARVFLPVENRQLKGMVGEESEVWKTFIKEDGYEGSRGVEATACLFINSRFERLKRDRQAYRNWRLVQVMLIGMMAVPMITQVELGFAYNLALIVCLYLSQVCLSQAETLATLRFARSSEAAVGLIHRTVNRAVLRRTLGTEFEATINAYVEKIVENSSEVMDLSIREAEIKAVNNQYYDIVHASRGLLNEVYDRDAEETASLLEKLKASRRDFVKQSFEQVVP